MSIHNEPRKESPTPISQLLEESGVELFDLKEERANFVMGDYSNNVRQYVGATKEGKRLAVFVKVFSGVASGAAFTKLENELRALEKLHTTGRDITYHVLGFSTEHYMLVTETLPDSDSLTSAFRGEASGDEAKMIEGTLRLLNFIHGQGVIHGDALPRNFSILTKRQAENPSDPYHGVVAIDFEKAQFREDLEKIDPEHADAQFETLEIADVLRFLFSVYPDTDSDEDKHKLVQYMQSQLPRINKVLTELYGNQFAMKVRKEID